MGKINLKLTNGVEESKNVISTFKVGNESYIIFDSESVGSMGLPIILVSKIEDNKVSKIVDQNEWQKTKEYLKLIISNAEMEYINSDVELLADEVYFTQLTLPQASFEAIKNNYKATETTVEETPFIPNVEVTPLQSITQEVVSIPVPEEVPVQVVPTIDVPVIPVIPVVEPVIPVMPVMEPVAVPVEPIIPIQPAIVMEPVPVIPVVEEVVTPIIPEVVPVQEIPAEKNIEVVNNEDKYNDMKETFMKSCENMFDALVKQMEKK